MNIAALKVDLVKHLLDTNNVGLINHIKALFDTQQTDLSDEMPDEIKASVERAMMQADRGELKSHKEVMKKYSRWRKK